MKRQTVLRSDEPKCETKSKRNHLARLTASIWEVHGAASVYTDSLATLTVLCVNDAKNVM